MPRSPVEIVAIASSAGGLAALRTLLSGLPADFRVPIVLVQHLDPNHRSLMADILSRDASLHVKQATAGEKLKPGTVYIAPPNRHLLISSARTVRLVDSAFVHFHRPSADLMFESVAATCRSGAVAVVLTGTGTDGSLGVAGIKKMGGTVIAQDEATSQFFGMPGSAIATGSVDFVLALDEIAGRLIELAEGEEGAD
jgi:two-component system chemotaxis response regulator CheB